MFGLIIDRFYYRIYVSVGCMYLSWHTLTGSRVSAQPPTNLVFEYNRTYWVSLCLKFDLHDCYLLFSSVLRKASEISSIQCQPLNLNYIYVHSAPSETLTAWFALIDGFSVDFPTYYDVHIKASRTHSFPPEQDLLAFTSSLVAGHQKHILVRLFLRRSLCVLLTLSVESISKHVLPPSHLFGCSSPWVVCGQHCCGSHCSPRPAWKLVHGETCSLRTSTRTFIAFSQRHPH